MVNGQQQIDSSMKSLGSSPRQIWAVIWQMLGSQSEAQRKQEVTPNQTRERIEPSLTMTFPLFHGNALCDVDADGNVVVPAFLAEAIDAEAELLVSKHGADLCLIGYGRAYLDTLRTRTEARRIADEAQGTDARNHFARIRRTFGVVEKMPRAGATIRIPAAMRHLGQIGGLALFVGTGDNFEIWNPDFAMTNEDAQFRDLAAWQLQARGINDAEGVH